MRNSSESRFEALSSTLVLLLDGKVRLVEIEKYGSPSPWLSPGAAAARSRSTWSGLQLPIMIFGSLSQNIPPEHTQKLRITGHGAPLGLGKSKQFVSRQSPDFSGVVARVVHHVSVAVFANLA